MRRQNDSAGVGVFVLTLCPDRRISASNLTSIAIYTPRLQF